MEMLSHKIRLYLKLNLEVWAFGHVQDNNILTLTISRLFNRFPSHIFQKVEDGQ